MDAYLGGDLMKLLRKYESLGMTFTDKQVRFYAACVIEAIDYLHFCNIIYRDMKPENLLLDKNGYVKLADFGLAKRISKNDKAFTFCGTIEYVCPEMINGSGHSFPVDYWAIGVLIYELFCQKSPFKPNNEFLSQGVGTGLNQDGLDQDEIKYEILANIKHGIENVKFSSLVPRKAEKLIKKLIRQEPTERLGYLKRGVDEIRAVSWFAGLDWDALREGNVKSEMRPDLMNFDDALFDEEKHARVSEYASVFEEENSGWDSEF